MGSVILIYPGLQIMYQDVLFAGTAHAGFRELGGAVYNSRVVPTPVEMKVRQGMV